MIRFYGHNDHQRLCHFTPFCQTRNDNIVVFCYTVNYPNDVVK